MGVGDYDDSLSWKSRNGYYCCRLPWQEFLYLENCGSKDIGNDMW
jgi:hypothetical protein